MAFKVNHINHIAECRLLKFKCTKQAEISKIHIKLPSETLKNNCYNNQKKTSLANDYEDNEKKNAQIN